jgi:hypothetical protein
MRNLTLILTIFTAALIIQGCSSFSREESDVYTISDHDTTYTNHVQNAPGNRDNGIIYPSSRVLKSERDLTQRDSVVKRYYPNFIRLGLFESIGTIGGSSDYSIGTGFFGVFPDYSKLSNSYRGDGSSIFSGGIYRIGIAEWRLRWFRDSPDWTFGVSGAEFLIPDSRAEKMLFSVMPFYIRKRIFLKREIPYISVTASAGLGLLPSQYLNLSASLDIGSIGGLNFRTYLGLAIGYNNASTAQISNNDFTKEAQTSVFPYFGFGMSVLDFLNLPKETEVEWKYYEHSSWDVGLLQFAFLGTTADKSIYANAADTSYSILKGFHLKFANASVALPFFNHKLYAGTSLLSLMVLGREEYAAAVLPLNIGYWQNIISDDLSFEPFLELGYYPSSFINFGGRIHARINDILNFSLIAGMARGNPGSILGKDLSREFGSPQNFTKFYLGIGINIYDRIFYEKELRYSK